MASSKKQNTPSLQTRAPTIPVIHRESLINPQHTLIVPAGYSSPRKMGPQSTDARNVFGNGPIDRPQGSFSEEVQPGGEVFEGWYSGFCVEPSNDLGTCCLGFWVPCALFGRTTWRLQQVTDGKDPLDSARKTGDGCNIASFAWWGISVISGGPCSVPNFAGILAGFQRTRIRGTYGIKGSLTEDCCKGFWCPVCTQIQNDREVRAREGQLDMRYSSKYLDWEASRPESTQLHSTQPAPAIEMVYVPTLQTCVPLSSGSRRSSVQSRRSISSSEPNSNTLKGKRMLKVPPIEEESAGRLQAELSAQQSTNVADKDPQTKRPQDQQRVVQKSADKPSTAEAGMGDLKRTKSRKAQISNPTLHSDTQIAITTEPQASQQPRKRSSITTSAKNNISEIQHHVDHARLAREHCMVECVVSGQLMVGDLPDEHVLADCETVEVADTSTAKGHTFDSCPIIVTRSVASNHQHSLSDCSYIIPSATPDLSYVHDFTDSPVREYYESQEQRDKQHKMTEDLLEDSRTMSTAFHSFAHGIEDCSGDQVSPEQSMSQEQNPKQRNLSGNTRKSSAAYLSLIQNIENRPAEQGSSSRPSSQKQKPRKQVVSDDGKNATSKDRRIVSDNSSNQGKTQAGQIRKYSLGHGNKSADQSKAQSNQTEEQSVIHDKPSDQSKTQETQMRKYSLGHDVGITLSNVSRVNIHELENCSVDRDYLDPVEDWQQHILCDDRVADSPTTDRSQTSSKQHTLEECHRMFEPITNTNITRSTSLTLGDGQSKQGDSLHRLVSCPATTVPSRDGSVGDATHDSDNSETTLKPVKKYSLFPEPSKVPANAAPIKTEEPVQSEVPQKSGFSTVIKAGSANKSGKRKKSVRITVGEASTIGDEPLRKSSEQKEIRSDDKPGHTKAKSAPSNRALPQPSKESDRTHQLALDPKVVKANGDVVASFAAPKDGFVNGYMITTVPTKIKVGKGKRANRANRANRSA